MINVWDSWKYSPSKITKTYHLLQSLKSRPGKRPLESSGVRVQLVAGSHQSHKPSSWTIAQSLPHKDNRLDKEKNGCQATLGESVVLLPNYPSKISIPVSHGPWNKFLCPCETDFNILVKVKAENKF